MANAWFATIVSTGMWWMSEGWGDPVFVDHTSDCQTAGLAALEAIRLARHCQSQEGIAASRVVRIERR